MTELAKFRVPVEYGDAPDPEEIFKRRPFRGGDWDPRYTVLDCCKNIPLVACELEMVAIDLGFMHGFENVVHELDVRGLRPLIYPELTSFIRKYPDQMGVGDLWGGFDLAAAGCYIQCGGAKHHPSYSMDPDSEYWGMSWPAGFGYRDQSKVVYDRFLAVKKGV